MRDTSHTAPLHSGAVATLCGIQGMQNGYKASISPSPRGVGRHFNARFRRWEETNYPEKLRYQVRPGHRIGVPVQNPGSIVAEHYEAQMPNYQRWPAQAQKVLPDQLRCTRLTVNASYCTRTAIPWS
jgi:hypothetical protein